MIEVALGWALLSTGFLLWSLELDFGTRGAIGAATLWAPLLALALACAVLGGVVFLAYVVCMVPVWMVGAVVRAWCARVGVGSMAEQKASVLE